MNSFFWTFKAAKGSNEKNDYFWATFEDGFFNLPYSREH